MTDPVSRFKQTELVFGLASNKTGRNDRIMRDTSLIFTVNLSQLNKSCIYSLIRYFYFNSHDLQSSISLSNLTKDAGLARMLRCISAAGYFLGRPQRHRIQFVIVNERTITRFWFCTALIALAELFASRVQYYHLKLNNKTNEGQGEGLSLNQNYSPTVITVPWTALWWAHDLFARSYKLQFFRPPSSVCMIILNRH